ncbi:MAG: DUF6491 family protein [Rhodospirillaceae bacterium]
MKTSLIALAAALVVGAATSATAADPVGSTHKCVRLSDIQDSPIIDDRTILLRMRGRDNFKRVDMRGRCSGMEFSGIGHSTPTAELCTSDSITVLQPVGAVCMIDQIVTIDKAEADTLIAKR